MAQDLLVRAIGDQLGPLPDRFINSILSAGVWDLSGDHFKVREQAAPGMSVRAGSGTAFDKAVVVGAVAGQETFIVRNQDPYIGSGDSELSIGNGDPSDDRIDLVVLRVYEDELDSSGLLLARGEVIPGTPASSPVAPAVPDGAIALASILVGAGESTSITSGDITDLRSEAATRGQYVETVQFTSSGTFDHADYPYLRTVVAKVQGAGGGGVGNGNGNGTGGAGGGAGGYAEAKVGVDALAASETVTVGAAGAGSSGLATASDGGSSAFGAHAVATGGLGGRDGGYGGPGGAGTSGDLLLAGSAGQSTSDLVSGSGGLQPGGRGGDSHLGGGGRGGPIRSSDQPGQPGGNYGGGGGGGFRSTSITGGGNGAQGVVLLDLYA